MSAIATNEAGHMRTDTTTTRVAGVLFVVAAAAAVVGDFLVRPIRQSKPQRIRSLGVPVPQVVQHTMVRQPNRGLQIGDPVVGLEVGQFGPG